MYKNDLIEALNEIPGNPLMVIYDPTIDMDEPVTEIKDDIAYGPEGRFMVIRLNQKDFPLVPTTSNNH